MRDPDELSAADEEREVALLGDGEPVDTVDVADEQWAPGEPPPGLPAEEVLTVHPLTAVEPGAEELELPPDALDALELPGGDELLETPAPEEPAEIPDERLTRTFLRGHDLDTRVEELDRPEE